MTDRTHRKYQLENPDRTIIRSGITKRPLEVREAELQREEKKPNARIRQVGVATTEKRALAWEKGKRTGTPPGGKRKAQ